MEPSQSSPVDSVHPSPMDALELSLLMNPGHHGSTPSSPLTIEPSQPSPMDLAHSPPTDAIESISKMYQKIDPVQRIDRLMSFVENHLQKMNALSEAGSSSSEVQLDTVWDVIKLAAKAIETISTEAEKLSNSDAVGSLTLNLMKEVGDSHWVFIGLSVAAYAIDNYLSVASIEKEFRDILLNILALAKDINEHSKRIPDDRGKVCNAVCTIVECTVICCDYLKRGKIFRNDIRFILSQLLVAQSEMSVTSSLRWNELPEQLREKILSRLPMKSHLRLRSVSKGWKSLLTSNAFLRQWALESPQKYWLMLCTANTQIPCLVYSFELESWQTLSLSFVKEKCGIRYKGSTSGLLLVDIRAYSSSGSSCSRVYVCNPLSRTFHKLPDIPNAVMASGIAGGDNGEGYKVIMLGKSVRNTIELHLYDSAERSWKPVPVALPETLAVRNEHMIFCDGKFFCLRLEAPEILVFDVHGDGSWTVLPMPSGSDIFSRLLTCGGFVLVAGAKQKDDVVEDVIIWQYCCPTWREVAKMSRSLCVEFQSSACPKWTWFECVGVGDNVCFRAHGSLEVLVYNTTRDSWTWLPTCAVTSGDREYKRLRILPFQPRPHLQV